MLEATHRTLIRSRRNLLWLALLQGAAAYAQGDADLRAEQPGAGDTARVAANENSIENGVVSGEAAADAPQAAQQDETSPSASSARRGKSADSTQLGTITVTAQKKVENIQKVPIAISAFGGEDLNDRKIETGGDLVTATPNVSFSKTNFAMYNFQIRGIGTQALSVTTDPAVAVSFNSTPMIRNRLFEQEYFDVDRVEVLRGPQGTLYGRNATAGVVNMIPNLPNFDGFESWIKTELGNYDSRRFSGMVNVPLTDTLAFRFAGAWTKRSGYVENTASDKDVDGRNLWSGRLSLAWKPAEGVNANLVWEHFRENDDRARTGKQLCHNDPGPETMIGTSVTQPDRNFMSQGCVDGSLYDRGAFGVPNGGSLPWVLAASRIGGLIGFRADPDGNYAGNVTLIQPWVNPYAGVTQSSDLRKIATTYDPRFKAKNDVVQFNFDTEIGDGLKFISQTLYTRDRYFSTQDYGRFQSNPVFTNTSVDKPYYFNQEGQLAPGYDMLPNGVFCDPQLGCSDRMLLADLVDSYSTQWSQEFRLQSSFDGMFNFSVGANYLHYKIDESYYVFNNMFTAIGQVLFNNQGVGTAPLPCPIGTATRPEIDGSPAPCLYIDPNPIGSLNGQGHNYFRSWNVAETKSAAIFGETYWQLSDTVKLTAGLRFTNDKKITTPIPSQALLTWTDLSRGYFVGGGYTGSGYPANPKIHQTWNEPTGRVVLDWTPQTSFTDSTLLYASVSRGYKAGGTNSPGIGANPDILTFEQRRPEFSPEFVNALEIGTKNVLAGGKLTLNATLFYNDYKDYQVSQIQDRATFNENFDAKTWGLELEAAWKPTPSFMLSGNIGLLGSRVGGGQSSIDVMDRTAGNPDWVVVRPWMQLASNCIAPRAYVERILQAAAQGLIGVNGSAVDVLNSFCTANLPINGAGFQPGGPYAGLLGENVFYDPRTDAPNGGAGFAKSVGGHSLPNAPHITVSVSPQYTFFTSHGDLILRADLYYQGESWARIYQDKIDRLHDWGNVNLSLTWQKLEEDLTVQFYVKNALGGEAITGTFLNSDDSGLTSNVFLQDPRFFGLSIRKGFY
ncbi:TonB-dependent receptor [Dokdonella ginsengisoli]|uniref:TonB-dependent receptor n=1 Tax=Dokdonella ginsengisoli TaxID=363846 RepID=A0ABV9QYQ2_9GAMM